MKNRREKTNNGTCHTGHQFLISLDPAFFSEIAAVKCDQKKQTHFAFAEYIFFTRIYYTPSVENQVFYQKLPKLILEKLLPIS